MKNRIRLTAVFVCSAVIIQCMALLFLTPAGIEKLYPLVVRLHSEKIEPDSNTYAVYYNTRVTVADADLVVIGIDGAVGESYDMLGHFSRFLKQYNNFSHVLLDFDRDSKKLASGMINETREKLFYNRLDALKSQIGLSEDYCDYLAELYVVNSTMVPVRKFELDSYSSASGADSLPKAVRIADTYARCDRSVLCIVDSSDFSPESTFAKELESLLPDKKIVFISAFYSKDSPSPETHELLTLPLTGDKAGIYFTENSRFEAFYRYYNAVTDIFGKGNRIEYPLDERYTDMFFIIANGTEAKYSQIREETESGQE